MLCKITIELTLSSELTCGTCEIFFRLLCKQISGAQRGEILKSQLAIPRTEEIGLETITTGKISNNFSQESPYISNKFSRESLKFQTSFHVSKRSPCHSKDLSGKLIDLEIQIFEVSSPPWLESARYKPAHYSIYYIK